MNRAQAEAELTDRMQARLNGLALQTFGQRGGGARIPAETASVLASIALDWVMAHGFQLDTSDAPTER